MKKCLPKVKVSMMTVFFFFVIFVNTGIEYFVPCLVSVLLHEAGHITAITGSGEKIERITVYPCGIDIKMQGKMLSYGREMCIALAGPCVSLLLFLLFCVLGENIWRDANAAYLMLNCLPIKYFDGGRALYSFICMISSEITAGKISRFISYCFIFLLWSVSVYFFFVTSGNFSLLLTVVCLFFRFIFSEKDV